MLKRMRELQKGSIPTPDHAEELAKIEQIFNELKPEPECSGARLRCLLDVEKKLREATAKEHFAAGFAMGWEIRADPQKPYRGLHRPQNSEERNEHPQAGGHQRLPHRSGKA